MSNVIIFIPVAKEGQAQTATDNQGIVFAPHLWRKGIPDPGITDWEHAVKCGVDDTVTHLMLWGDLATAHWQGFRDNITGCVVYNAATHTRRTAMANMGLNNVIEPEEPTVEHDLVMPLMYKIWDMADAPIDTAICSRSDKFDGHTCSLRYDAGVYVRGVEQGDSTRGLDRTNRLGTMVPNTLSNPARMQIEGEVITNRNDPRYATHAMHGATRREFFSYECKLIVFDVRMANGPFTTWYQAMEWLDAQGFDTVLNYTNTEYPKDGEVFRIDNVADYELAEIKQFAYKHNFY